MTAKKKDTRPTTVELTPEHVAAAIKNALYPFENYDENDGVNLSLDLHDNLFKLTKATKFVSTKNLNANKKGFMEAVQAALIPEYMRKAEWRAQSGPVQVHEVLDIEDQSDDGLFIQVKVKMHGLHASKAFGSASKSKFDYWRKA